jgi:transcriptional regulator with PAS, ATPase and Fis domain
MAIEHSKSIAGFTDKAVDAMSQYDWPGNIRELENLIERGVILVNPGDNIDAIDLFPALPESKTHVVNANGDLQTNNSSSGNIYEQMQASQLSLDSMTSLIIQEAVSRSGGNLAAAARALGITRPQLSYRLEKAQTMHFNNS